MTDDVAGKILHLWLFGWFHAGLLFGLGLVSAYFIADSLRFFWQTLRDWLEDRA